MTQAVPLVLSSLLPSGLPTSFGSPALFRVHVSWDGRWVAHPTGPLQSPTESRTWCSGWDPLHKPWWLLWDLPCFVDNWPAGKKEGRGENHSVASVQGLWSSSSDYMHIHMYVCVCIYMCIYIYIHRYICIHTQICTYYSTRIYIYTHCIYTCMYWHTHIRACMWPAYCDSSEERSPPLCCTRPPHDALGRRPGRRKCSVAMWKSWGIYWNIVQKHQTYGLVMTCYHFNVPSWFVWPLLQTNAITSWKLSVQKLFLR